MREELMPVLRIHASRLAHSMLSLVTPRGSVLVGEQGSVREDLVSAHHILEVAYRLDAQVFGHYTRSILSWMTLGEEHLGYTPFIVDSIALLHRGQPDLKELLEREIVAFQMTDSSFDKFTAYAMGGDYFSTLWCSKILINSGIEEFDSVIRKALDYLIMRRSIAAKTLGQSGYLLLLLSRFDYQHYGEVADAIAAEVSGVIRERSTAPSEQLLDSLFLIEDLIEHFTASGSSESLECALSFLVHALQLDQPVGQMPAPLSAALAGRPMTVQVETLCRAAVSSVLMCRALGQESLAYEVNGLLLSDLQEAKVSVAAYERQFGDYLDMYKDMHEKFRGYEPLLAKIDRTTPKHRSVFIMMPFKDDDNYRNAAKVVKEECAKRGFCAFRVDENSRKFLPTLWENLLVNMLSAKYAVAMYVSEPVVNIATASAPEKLLFPNPNVALEFGFFSSRGQNILVLKDVGSTLPTDLGGFLWSPFRIANPESLRGAISEWLVSLEAAETIHPTVESSS